ncbi:Coiled-coil domain-containing protein 19, mitochondrial [Papilio machaon]|uniref:Cilia- and flagella-associated protein 45 n=1 Tax=Papilio machaon TaxID=76193 RepID=A0A0N1I855_PAPMA|nr:Coiled-coil domain-containing protein 19, mitochondrial [Papilio machaon]
MPKVLKNLHEGIPYHKIRKGSDPGCYQLHRPSECRLKFPITKRPIHKCEIPKREYTRVPQGESWRDLIVPKTEPNFYPAVMHKSEFERLKKQAKIVSQEEQLKAMHEQEAAIQKAAKESEERKQLLKEKLLPQPGAQVAAGAADQELEGPDQTAHTLSRAETMHEQEAAIQKAAKESEERKQLLKEKLLPQPGAQVAAGAADQELEGPDQTAHTLSRAEILKADNMPGPRLCNRIILASKCHAIRDAQISEKDLIKKELTEEERRLDAIMEENRQAAVRRAEQDEERRHQLRLQNLAALKEQIQAHDTAKVLGTKMAPFNE